LVFIAEHASRLYALKAGEIVKETTAEILKSDEEVKKLYFG
jgi:ABC-type branched-subunit amino acid transport system ATPase component